MKKYVPVLLGALFSIVIMLGLSHFSFLGQDIPLDTSGQLGKAVVNQQITDILTKPVLVTKVYDKGQLIGMLTSEKSVLTMLNQVYEEHYKNDFPSSQLSLGRDTVLSEELSYYRYEDKDQEIAAYLASKNDFTVETYGIEFSDEKGVFATIYVDDVAKYQRALEKYLSFFIDPAALALISKNQTPPALKNYGTRDLSITILQNVSMITTYANPNEIKRTEDEILEFLKYGNNLNRQYYTISSYEMIEGVGSKVGLSAQQVVNINHDVLSSTEQVLDIGMKLCVTYFTSPLDIIVTKENMKKDIVYPGEPLYITDENMLVGSSEVEQKPLYGSKNVLVEETWVNGVLVKGKEISSIVTLQPQQEIIRKGSKEIPGVGTGNFRWPVLNPIISCRWGCYPGHQAIDIQNSYDRYGALYASDRGTIMEVGYTGINGNYVIIDHGNGFLTYYGHMNVPCFYEVGTKVDQGQEIGQIGKTGKATGPHVHFFIVENGERRDPCQGFLEC